MKCRTGIAQKNSAGSNFNGSSYVVNKELIIMPCAHMTVNGRSTFSSPVSMNNLQLGELTTDTINELTAGNGVDIEGTNTKAGTITTNVLCANSNILSDLINEKTPGNGVTVSGVSIKSGDITTLGTMSINTITGDPTTGIDIEGININNGVITPSPVAMAFDPTFSDGAYYGSGTMSQNGGPNTVTIGVNANTDSGSLNDNIALGVNASAQVANSLAIGANSSAGAIGATDNIAIGKNAGNSAATGGWNTALGVNTLTALTTGVNNTSMGHGSGVSITTGMDNTILGHNADTAGSGAIIIGENAKAGTGVLGNITIGKDAGNLTSTGTSNIIIGSQVANNTTGSQNIAIGSNSLRVNTAGTANISIGAFSGYFNETGVLNVYLGSSAGGQWNGDSNVGVGPGTCGSTTNGGGSMVNQVGTTITFTGSGGIRFSPGDVGGSIIFNGGAQTADILTYVSPTIATSSVSQLVPSTNIVAIVGLPTGNVAVGRSAMGAIQHGVSENTAVGNGAMGGFSDQALGGDRNDVFGAQAFYKIYSGSDNTIMGSRSCYHLGLGNFNVTAGGNTLKGFREAANNVAMGYNAIHGTELVGSIASGLLTVTSVNTGVIYVGMKVYQAGGSVSAGYTGLPSFIVTSFGTGTGGVGTYNISTGSTQSSQQWNGYFDTVVINNTAIGYRALETSGTSNNTAIGYETLLVNTTGTTNTALGYQAGMTVSSGSNITCIGANAQASSPTASNEITLGDSGITIVRSFGAWTFLSDQRDKKDIEPLKAGLDFVNKLNPVKFNWNMRELDGIPNTRKDIPDTGFLAQDLQNVQEETITIPGLVHDANPERLEISPSKLIPILVKALQEANDKIDKLTQRLDEMDERYLY